MHIMLVPRPWLRVFVNEEMCKTMGLRILN
jgi:hypothetical protein